MAVQNALKDTEDLTETRNAIVHGVWMEIHLDDEGILRRSNPAKASD